MLGCYSFGVFSVVHTCFLRAIKTTEQWRNTYPRLTPSICKSTHHIPGTPRIIHNAAFFPNEPMGSHEKIRK